MKVKASMKKDVYDTEVALVAFTINEIVACKCSCRCGSQDLQRTVCVHILPCLELLGFFIKQSLAEHILVESSCYVKKTNLNNVDKILLTKLRNCYEILLISCRVDNLQETLNASSFRELLSGFDVGTDRTEFGPKPPLDPLDLGPLNKTNFHSIRYIAREIRTGKVSDIIPKQFQTNIREPMTYIMYKKTLEACSTICALLPKSSTNFLTNNMVGYRLLETRCQYAVSFDKIIKYNSSLHELKRAIKEGNCEFRIIKKKQQQTITILTLLVIQMIIIMMYRQLMMMIQ